MFRSQKHIFWEALIITLFLFGIGIITGIILESWRTNNIDKLYKYSEIELLDIKTQNEIYNMGSFDCDIAIQENLKFANKIYEEAELLGRYEKASRLTDNLKLEHKKYDLLRTLLWMNAIKIKEKCNADYHNVVYIYDYNDASIKTKAKQSVFSKILEELKKEKGNEIMLIPMAGDNNLSSINLMMELYNISESELPVILIDEKIKITKIEEAKNIRDLL